MLIENNIEYRLEYKSNDILNFKGFDTLDLLILSDLNEKFINRCYNRSLIIEILRINERSRCINIKDSLDGDMYVNVSFGVKCYSFEEGEIITNNKIKTIMDAGHYIGYIDDLKSNPNNVIQTVILSNNSLKFISINDIIPIIVTKIEYKKDKNKMLIVGIAFNINEKYGVYNNLNKIYNITSNIVNNNANGASNIDDDLISNVSRKKVEWYNKNTFASIKTEIIDNLNYINKYPNELKMYNKILNINEYESSKTINLHDSSKNNEDMLVYVPLNYELSMYKLPEKVDKLSTEVTLQHNEFLKFILNQKLVFVKLLRNFIDLELTHNLSKNKKIINYISNNI